MKKLAIAAAVLVATIGAQAQTYVEIGYVGTTAKGKDDGDSFKSSPAAFRGILGHELNPNLAIEGMLAVGVGDANVKLNGERLPNVKYEIDNAVGLYLKPKTKLNDNVEIFARAGFARARATATAVGVTSVGNSESSFSYGAGMSYAISPKTALNVDYMQYLNKDGFKVNGFTFGVGFKF